MMPEPVAFPSNFFTLEQEGGVYIASLNRVQLSDDDNLEQLSQDFNLVVDKCGISRLVLRLNGVRYMTSSAIGRLITLHRKMNRSEGILVLSEPTPDVGLILDTARLLTYFTVRSTLTEAIQACGV